MAKTFLQICPKCSVRLELPMSMAGQSARCLGCKTAIVAKPNPRLIAEDFVRMVRVLTFVAYADGEYVAEEDSIIEKFVDKLRSVDPSADIKAIVNEGKHGKHLRVPRTRENRQRLTRAVVDVVAADGRIDAAEAKVLKALSERLKVDREDLIAAALHQAEVQAEQYAESQSLRRRRDVPLEHPIAYVRKFLPTMLRGSLVDVNLMFTPMLAYPQKTITQDWLSVGQELTFDGKDALPIDVVGIYNYALNHGRSRCLIIQFPWPELVNEIAFACLYFKKDQYPALFTFEMKAKDRKQIRYGLNRFAAGAFFSLSDFVDGADAVDFRDPTVFFKLVAASLVEN